MTSMPLRGCCVLSCGMALSLPFVIHRWSRSVSSHVSRVFDHFCAEVDSLVGRLQEELGGDKELLEVVPPPTQH